MPMTAVRYGDHPPAVLQLALALELVVPEAWGEVLARRGGFPAAPSSSLLARTDTTLALQGRGFTSTEDSVSVRRILPITAAACGVSSINAVISQ